MIVCLCAGVRERDLERTCREGARTLEDVSREVVAGGRDGRGAVLIRSPARLESFQET
ncbi:MAG: (2Fe-2S)-binding protein [Nitrospirae bacterium]|nr:(2Fe-2S)-binding protein [Nitrospirota bacterium]